MTCTGARLAAFFAMDSQLSVPRDVRRSSCMRLSRNSHCLPLISKPFSMAESQTNPYRPIYGHSPPSVSSDANSDNRILQPIFAAALMCVGLSAMGVGLLVVVRFASLAVLNDRIVLICLLFLAAVTAWLASAYFCCKRQRTYILIALAFELLFLGLTIEYLVCS